MIGYVVFRPTCRLDGTPDHPGPLKPAGVRILGGLDAVARKFECVLEVSAAREDVSVTQKRAPTDPHPLGEAFDVSVKGFDDAKVVLLWRAIALELGPLFTVLYERRDTPTNPQLAEITYLSAGATAPHFHIQRKKGTVYPPLAA